MDSVELQALSFLCFEISVAGSKRHDFMES